MGRNTFVIPFATIVTYFIQKVFNMSIVFKLFKLSFLNVFKLLLNYVCIPDSPVEKNDC